MGLIIFILSFCLMVFGSISKYSFIRVPSVFIGFAGLLTSIVLMFGMIVSM